MDYIFVGLKHFVKQLCRDSPESEFPRSSSFGNPRDVIRRVYRPLAPALRTHRCAVTLFNVRLFVVVKLHA